MIPTNVHSFSRPFARQHGPTSAVLLKHLAHKVREAKIAGKPKNFREGKWWHFNSANTFAKKLPYLSASTISATVKKLEAKGFLEIGCFNTWPHDKTKWYHVPEQHWDSVEEDLLRFDTNVAKEHGIIAAVLHFNLYHFLKLQVKKKVANPMHEMSPSGLAKLLPFSESAITKNLKRLVLARLILKGDGSAKYTFPEPDLRMMRQTA